MSAWDGSAAVRGEQGRRPGGWRRYGLCASIAVLAALGALVPSRPALASPSAASPAAGPASPVPAGLARVIHARLGAGPVWTSTSTPTAKLSDHAGPNSTLGYSVALSSDGTTALVGDWGVNDGRGAAFIFHTTAEDAWSTKYTATAKLTDAAGPAGATLGISVALSSDGTTALVSAPDTDSRTGAAYIFHASAEGAWASTSIPAAALTDAAGAANDMFGDSVSLSADGTTALIGAEFAGPGGAAYIFRASAENAWASSSSPTAALTNAAGPSGQQFGGAVTLSADGTIALVGAELTGPPFESGAVYVFRAHAEGAWTSTSSPTATLSDAAGSSEAAVGSAVALSADGSTALVGAFGESAALIYHASAENAWTSMSVPAATLTHGGTSDDSFFGFSVALSATGTTALVGDWQDPTRAPGTAFVFQAPSETGWVSTTKPTAQLTLSGANKDSRFGFSVALPADGAIALIGAPLYLGRGAALIYSAS